MANILLERTTPPPPASKKDGDFYDRCPSDGCLEVDRSYKKGGTTGRGETYLDWSMYHADPRRGGCGTSWARTTKQGVEWDHKKGIDPKWKTRSAIIGSFQLSTSELYRRNYDCAFQKCGCVVCADLWTSGLRAWCMECLSGAPLTSED